MYLEASWSVFSLVAQLRDNINQKDEEISKILQTMEQQAKELELLNEGC